MCRRLSLPTMSKLSFSLAKTKKSAESAPSLKRPAAFASLDDDEPVDAAPTSSADKNTAAANKKLLAQNVLTSKVMKKRMDAEKKVDASVYEYDEIWDKMQEAKQKQKEAKEIDSAQRKVCQCSVRFFPLLISPAKIYTWSPAICSYAKT